MGALVVGKKSMDVTARGGEFGEHLEVRRIKG